MTDATVDVTAVDVTVTVATKAKVGVDAKVKVRKKRLVVALTKRETLLASDKAWPDLFCSAASFPASDVSAPLAD